MEYSGLKRSLSPAFGGVEPTFLCDSAEVVNVLRRSDIAAFEFTEIDHLDQTQLANVVMVPISFDKTPLGTFIERTFAGSAMLVIPIASFCQTERGALYFLSLLADIDLARCVDGNRRWIDELERADELRFRSDSGTAVEVSLSDELFLMSPKTSVPIALGEWVSIAQYLEVGLVSHANGQRPTHVTNGTFNADGIVVASHRYAQAGVLQLVGRAFEFMRSVRARNSGAPVVIEIEDSQPIRISCGREDITAAAKDFTDPNRRKFLTEVAFAADAHWPTNRVDWSVNSQLNEAIGGIHLGLGTGVTGVHIDFVATDAMLVN